MNNDLEKLLKIMEEKCGRTKSVEEMNNHYGIYFRFLYLELSDLEFLSDYFDAKRVSVYSTNGNELVVFLETKETKGNNHYVNGTSDIVDDTSYDEYFGRMGGM